MASKSPTLVYERGESGEWIGGAGVGAAQCQAAGAKVTLTTAGETVKERIIVEGVKVAEFHTPARNPDNAHTIVPDGWPMTAPDAVIMADFRHGIFTPERIAEYLEGLSPNILTAADSQTTDICWGNILDFAGCNLLFANEREARFALKDQQSPLDAIGEDLHMIARVDTDDPCAVFLKRGPHGLTIYANEGQRLEFPAYAHQPIVDPIGAGDALLAYATLTYAVTRDLKLAGEIGSMAAAVACAHEGNVPVTPQMILELSR